MHQRKGLLQILMEIHRQVPDARLEHVPNPDDPAPDPWEMPQKKVLPVSQWFNIVLKDLDHAPTAEAQDVITGRYYTWHRDEFGRAIIQAEHRGEMINMFEEVWAGEPE
jgi:hypothetical protein